MFKQIYIYLLIAVGLVLASCGPRVSPEPIAKAPAKVTTVSAQNTTEEDQEKADKAKSKDSQIQFNELKAAAIKLGQMQVVVINPDLLTEESGLITNYSYAAKTKDLTCQIDFAVFDKPKKDQVYKNFSEPFISNEQTTLTFKASIRDRSTAVRQSVSMECSTVKPHNILKLNIADLRKLFHGVVQIKINAER